MGVFIGPAFSTHPALGAAPASDDLVLIEDVSTGEVTKVTVAQLTGVTSPETLTQAMTASGAVTAGVESVELSHATVAIAATIADAADHQGTFIVKALLEPGAGQDHTVTLTSGTWNGTNTIATFADINDTLVVYFDSAGNGTVMENIGTVGLSGP